jgi:hypothetical protein
MSIEDIIISNNEKFKNAINSLHDYVRRTNELNTLKFKNEFSEYDNAIDKHELHHICLVNNNMIVTYNNNMVFNSNGLYMLSEYNLYSYHITGIDINIAMTILYRILESCKNDGVEITLTKYSHFKMYEDYCVVSETKNEIIDGEELYFSRHFAIYKKDLPKIIQICFE